ncbi:UNVERIFIED_CONTAM: hypothetical protein NCL1_63712 [Trichonephila clavipes]
MQTVYMYLKLILGRLQVQELL